jgi:Uma2 family endonuclease
MPSVAAKVTPEEYLERERTAEFKSEYRDGEIVAMSGASFRHGVIVTNMVIEAGLQLRKRPCKLISTDLKVAVRAANLITYPDVLVVCGPPVFAYDRQDVLLDPIVLIEVLSKSTAKYDRGEKFAAYRTIPSLKEYLTVAQDQIHVEQHVRQTNEQWSFTKFSDAQDVVKLQSISVDLRLAEIYEDIELTEL